MRESAVKLYGLTTKQELLPRQTPRRRQSLKLKIEGRLAAPMPASHSRPSRLPFAANKRRDSEAETSASKQTPVSRWGQAQRRYHQLSDNL